MEAARVAKENESIDKSTNEEDVRKIIVCAGKGASKGARARGLSAVGRRPFAAAVHPPRASPFCGKLCIWAAGFGRRRRMAECIDFERVAKRRKLRDK